MWCSERRAVLLGLGALAGCGFRPLHAPDGAAAAGSGQIAVDVIDGSAGFALRARLVEQLGVAEAPTHRLAVALDLDQRGVAITAQDVTSRFEIVGVARYTLVPVDSPEAVLSGEAVTRVAYSAPVSDAAQAFAIVSAQRDAERRVAEVLAEDIASRLFLDAERWAR